MTKCDIGGGQDSERELCAYHRVLWRNSAFPAEPLTFRNIRHTITVFPKLLDNSYVQLSVGLTLVYCEITPITKYDSVGVLSLRVVADSTR